MDKDKDRSLSKNSGQITVLLWQLLYSKTNGHGQGSCNIEQLDIYFREADLYNQPAVKTAIGETSLVDCSTAQVHWLIYAVADLVTKAQYRLLVTALKS
jgi:hypothetical protein